jgi:hypothetical protein
MPIDFPSNPSSGQTYSYAGQQWEYNGVAWDKTTGSGSGPTGPTGPQGNTGATGAQGEPGQSSNYYSYKVHTTTQTPPTGNGEIRYNNATQTSSTILYLDHLDNNGDDIDIFLSLLKQNDNLIIQDASDSNNYQTWRINSAPTVILNDYTSIPVTGITSAGTGTSGFANNHQVLFIVFSSPIATAYVESLRGLTGAVGITNGSGIGLSVSGNTLTVSNTGVLSFNGLTGAVTGVTTGNANTFGPLQSFTNGISSAGGTFSALTRFTAGISASGGVTLAGSLQGSTASFSGPVTINKSSAFGITAESRFAVQYSSFNYTAVNKLYSYYTSSSALVGVTICKISYATTFDNVSGSFKITIANKETSFATPYDNLSTFMVTLSDSNTLNWSEISLYNGLSAPVYSLSYDGDYISISVTQSIPKAGTLNYMIEIERIG